MGVEAESLKSGFDTRYTFEDLAAHGIRLRDAVPWTAK